MPEPDEVVMMVCARIGDPHGHPIPGSVHRFCQECGVEVWLAPSGQQLLDSGPVDSMVYCVPCGVREMTAKGIKPERPIREQIAEIADALTRQSRK